jgi:hypothetical protein
MMQSVLQETQLPPKPDVVVHEPVQVPPKRRRGWLIAAGVAGFITLVGGVGAIAQQSQEQATTSNPVVVAPDVPVVDAPDAPSETDRGTMEAAAMTVPLGEEAVAEMEAAATAATAMDIDGASGHLRNAGDLWTEISSVWVGVDPYLEATAGQVADHLYNSADDLANYEIDSATREIEMSSALIDDLTSYAEGLEASA